MSQATFYRVGGLMILAAMLVLFVAPHIIPKYSLMTSPTVSLKVDRISGQIETFSIVPKAQEKA